MGLYGAPPVPPPFRRLRIFSVDPALSIQLETVDIDEVVVQVPWEVKPDTSESVLRPGPVGEYLEVVDYDPASGVFYPPVDLDEPYLIAQDGLAPSEGDPQFHQQMVYAVAMTTIGHFERALGRVALWAPRLIVDEDGKTIGDEFVRRLRIYPHALREANAYYSPAKKALLFGYFPTSSSDPEQPPGSMVFTCLSHDIVAHETTHALLDGMHPRFNEGTNPDVYALHEAFADIVAIFQHFSYPGVLRHQIARTRGDLAAQNLLGQLAQQFGQAIGRGGALRDALGWVDDEDRWHPRKPDPEELARTRSPHARGAILVAAVFDAFLRIYKARIADLLRIATHGSGVLPDGEIHPDLVERLAGEAAKTAQQVLLMCIRALDYCPPVDVSFGDYLRAVITADADLNPEDPLCYRVAFIESFRRRGIYPHGVRGLSEGTLLWPTGVEALLDLGEPIAEEVAEEARTENVDLYSAQQKHMRQDFGGLIRQSSEGAAAGQGRGAVFLRPPEDDGDGSADLGDLSVDWDLGVDREVAYENMRQNALRFHAWLTRGEGRKYARAFGLTLDEDAPPSVTRGRDGKTPAVEIHSVRTALRRGCRGSVSTELVVEITQRRRGYYDADKQRRIDSGEIPVSGEDRGDFPFRRGCTILIHPGTLEVRRVIHTPGTVADDRYLNRLRSYLKREDPMPDNAFQAQPGISGQGLELFAHLHRFAG